MSTENAVVESPRKPRRQAAKSTAIQVAKSTKTAVYLSAESMRKLGVTSLMEGKSQSQIVDELIKLHLRRYVIQTRDRSGLDDLAGHSSEEVSAAA